MSKEYSLIRPIKTQNDLDLFSKQEENKFYISIAGQIGSFNGVVLLTKIQSEERMAQVAAGQSDLISELTILRRNDELEDALSAIVKTYLIPFRVQ